MMQLPLCLENYRLGAHLRPTQLAPNLCVLKKRFFSLDEISFELKR